LLHEVSELEASHSSSNVIVILYSLADPA